MFEKNEIKMRGNEGDKKGKNFKLKVDEYGKGGLGNVCVEIV